MSAPSTTVTSITPAGPGRILGFGYNPALDGLRAISIVGVVMGHMQVGHLFGYHGVTLFFVISGYLITSLLIQEFDSTGRIRLGHFYWRRFARLGPALILASLVSLLWLVAIREPLTNYWAGVVGSLTYTMDLIQAVFGNGHVGFYYQYTWSLAIEEQFYLLWPLILLLLLRLKSRWWAMGFLMAGVAFTWYARHLQDIHTPSHELQMYGPISHADSLMLGCLVAIVLTTFPITENLKDVARTLGPLGALGLLYIATHGNGFASVTRYDAAGFGQTAIFSAMVVLWVAVVPRGLFARQLSLRPLAFVGKLSYGIYLWNLLFALVYEHVTGHRPGLDGSLHYIPWAIALLVWCWLCYRFVETPLRKRWAPPKAHAVVPVNRGREAEPAQQAVVA